MDLRVPKRQLLTGSDYFHLLLDRNMIRKGLVGNISRYHLVLDPSTDLDKPQSQLSANPVLNFVGRLTYTDQWPFPSVWKEKKESNDCISVHSQLSIQTFEKTIINRRVNRENGLVHIDLCELTDGSKHMVISMHHVLFDHQGMKNFLNALQDSNSVALLFPEQERASIINWIWNVLYTTVYVLKLTTWNIGTLIRKNRKITSNPSFKRVQFSESETQNIESNAIKSCARLSRSAFYTATTAKLVFDTLRKRGHQPQYLWFSTPHDNRKKGTTGHLISNQLSFFFFKIGAESLGQVKDIVRSMNHQIKDQLRKKVPYRYTALLEAFRFIPMWLYNAMVNLTTNGQVASFGFSDLGEERKPLEEFLGAKVLETRNYPPVPCPPGFNVIAKKENGQLQFTWAYYDEVVSETEIEAMESDFRQLLLGVS